ncbi:MAG: hypothetical protein IT385_03855 [Deltaproteobacteria bacterium]|nr:hypothetical protein [Deltaproteobacteria bacterium]
MALHDHRDAASAADLGPTLPARAALEGGCATCRTAPCCWYVPVQHVRLKHFTDVDHLVYCAGFDRIEIGWHANGEVVVYYRAPCRYLGPQGRGCSAYGSALMPQICRSASAHDCWFRANVPAATTDAFVRLDEPRMRAVAELFRFDLARAIERQPTWTEVRAAVDAIDAAERDGAQAPMPPSGDPPAEVTFPWEAPIDEAAPPPVELGWEQAIASPCDGCRAACCTHLIFETSRPRSFAALDRLRFILQFPGTEIGVRDEETWLVVIRTRCRHLTADARCGLFGSPRRPRGCTDYNAWSCTYVDRFERRAAGDTLRLRYEQLLEVASLYEFTPTGEAMNDPPRVAEVIRLLAARGSEAS